MCRDKAMWPGRWQCFVFCFCFGPGHEAQVFGIAPMFPADLAFFCGWILCTLVNYLDGVLHGEDFAALG